MDTSHGSDTKMDTDRLRLGISGPHRGLLVVAAAMTWALVSLGGAVCMTGDGLACADWPRCAGGLLPPPRLDAWVEYTHRFFVMTTFPLVLGLAAVTRLRHRTAAWLTRPLAGAVALFVVVAIFGAFASVRGLPTWVAAVDVGSALSALALVVMAAVLAGSRGPSGRPVRFAWGDGFSRLSLVALGAVFAVLVTGVLVAAPGSMVRCIGWPVFGGAALTADRGGLAGGARLGLAILAAVLVLAAAVQAFRTQRARPAVRRAALVAGCLLLAELAAGAVLPGLGFPVALRVAHVALTAGVWASLVAVVVLAGLPADEHAHQPAPS